MQLSNYLHLDKQGHCQRAQLNFFRLQRGHDTKIKKPNGLPA